MKELASIKGLPTTLYMLHSQPLSHAKEGSPNKEVSIKAYQTNIARVNTHYKPISKIVAYENLP